MLTRVSSLFLLVAIWAATTAAQSLPTLSGSRITCTHGKAGMHACHEIDMLSRVSMDDLYAGQSAAEPLSRGLNDIWGWTDPDSRREYALVGRMDAVAFVDVTIPTEPVYLGYLPSHDGGHSWWRDMKVYKDHMFVVVDGGGVNGMQVFDLTRLRSFAGQPVRFEQTARYGEIEQAHNVAINEETGFAYIVGTSRGGCPGLHMVDIRNPLEPKFAGCHSHSNTGRSGRGYTHDTQCVVYRGPDTDYYGREICFSSNETALSIMDVTDKSAAFELAAEGHPNVAYAHQGWLTEDHRYFVMNDEGDERQGLTDRTRMLIWDVTKLDEPVIDTEFLGQTHTPDHNLYARAGYIFASNYTSGLRVFDLSNPSAPVEVAYFDTHPATDDLSFNGTWSVYPFFASGTIIVNSHPDGLLVLDPTSLNLTRVSVAADHELPTALTLSHAWPNPFNPSTTLAVSLPEAANLSVAAYDLLGRRVASLHNGTLDAGRHLIAFDATDLPGGTYIIQARAGQSMASQRVTLVK